MSRGNWIPFIPAKKRFSSSTALPIIDVGNGR